MRHFYSNPFDCYPVEAQHNRLAVARAIADAGIPGVVWGEDALAFAHCVPTMLFALQILVPDKLVTTAASVITSHLAEFELELAETPSPRWLEYSLARARAGPHAHALPESAYLFHPLHDKIPESMASSDRVWSMEIHPQSAFQFDVEDLSSSRVLVPGLPPSNALVRFPTRAAFLDSLLATHIDNKTPYYHVKFHARIKTYIQYLVVYTLGMEDCMLPNGSALRPEAEALVAELRPENRPFMRDYLMFGSGVKSMGPWREQRRMIIDSANSHRRPAPSELNGEHFYQRRTMFMSAVSLQGSALPTLPPSRTQTKPLAGLGQRVLSIGRKIARRG